MLVALVLVPLGLVAGAAGGACALLARAAARRAPRLIEGPGWLDVEPRIPTAGPRDARALHADGLAATLRTARSDTLAVVLRFAEAARREG